ncbi:hypothetical protein B7P43_G08975 [Cryptotermes secundus]|uniref:Uncharacterized protein n=2 Tax=Cryptotermes secundus TaxID=105785 RepID=A0A2J7RC05_9NEOP|nr:uncharacterized protein LOC111862092 isoform X3 [Cryptotermes secundus]PNF38367.1 hypothetical protein B7P43_G08975 [Cryptotermes secundus]
MWAHLTILMMALMALASGPPGVQCSKDGYNIYKDLILRGKFDALEGADEQLDAEEVSSSPKLYFYRTPLLVQPNDGFDYVIGRDAVEEPLQAVDAEAVSEGNPKSGGPRDRFPLPRTLAKRDTGPRHAYTSFSSEASDDTTVLSKRGPGSILTWALSSKRPLVQSDLRQLNFLHPGVGGPTSFIATMGKREYSLQ